MNSPRPKLLVADDHPHVIKVLEKRFQQAGFDVLVARDGYTALATANRERPDAMVLDVNMPAGDGFSVQERLDKDFGSGGPPVIYITGDRSDRLDELAEDLGAYAVLHKPFSFMELLAEVKASMKDKAA